MQGGAKKMRVTEKWREEISKGLTPESVVKALDPKSVEVEAGGADTRKAAFIISTGDEDRDGDVVNPSGWKLDAYRKNPIVLWAHDVKAPPIARCETIAVKGGKLRAETVFPEKGVYPFADTVCGLVKGGFLSGTSVGFHPIEAKPRGKSKGVQFDVMELYEFSILPVPSNREALVEAKAAGHDIAPVVKWAEEFLDRAQETGLWVPRYQIEKALKAVLPITVTVPRCLRSGRMSSRRATPSRGRFSPTTRSRASWR
jgi:HK97 family phage prohead protease